MRVALPHISPHLPNNNNDFKMPADMNLDLTLPVSREEHLSLIWSIMRALVAHTELYIEMRESVHEEQDILAFFRDIVGHLPVGTEGLPHAM